MEARELRSGNFVNKGSYYGEEAITAYELYQFSLPLKSIADYYKEWMPIPITEEWLVKFRFGSNLNKVIGLIDFNVIYSSCCEIEINKQCIKIEHVHQLQNLYFALTRKELTLKNT